MAIETLYSGPGTFSDLDEVRVIVDDDHWKTFVQSLGDRPSPGPVQLTLASRPIDFSANAVVVVFATKGLKLGETLAADDVSRSGDELLVRAHVQPLPDAPPDSDGPTGLQTIWLIVLVPRGVADGVTSAKAEFGSQLLAMNPGSEPVLA